MEEIFEMNLFHNASTTAQHPTYSVFPLSSNATMYNETQRLGAMSHNATATSASDLLLSPSNASLPPAGPTFPSIAEDALINNIYVQAAFTLVYGTIFVVGTFGNILVCYVVSRNKAMHTVTNFFITNLAVSDIMLCVLAVPFTPLYTFMTRWAFGSVMCHLLACAQAVSVYISSFTLTSIAVDRFIVIIYPFRNRMKVSTCICVIAGCWFLSTLLTIPYGYFVQLTFDNETNNSYCEENWPSENYRKIFGTFTVTLQFVLPFLIISACYILVSYKLNDRARSKPGTKSAKKEEADRERKKRTNRMLIAMVGVFGVSWLPMSAINVINDYYEIKGGLNLVMFFVFHCLAMSSTCYNPFLYAWLNENFRKEFKQILPFFRRSNGYSGVDGGGGGGGGGISYGSRGRSDRLNSQADGNSLITRASEIIPRGPTTHSSIKKVIRDGPLSFTATTDVPIMADVEWSPGNGAGSEATNGLTSTKMLPTGLLETQFGVGLPVMGVAK